MNELIKPNKIIYAKRKSIALILNDNAELIVRAPLRAKMIDIERFVNDKQEWLKRKRNEILSNRISAIKGETGERLVLLDEVYTIVLYNGKRVKKERDYIYLPIVNSITYLKNYIIKLAKTYIPNRTNILSNIHGVSFNAVSISSAKTRWGSCSYNNKLNFTYRLVLCPKVVIDYIIIHELSHVLIKSHSKVFWHKVEQMMPNYKACERWLKTHKSIINII